MIIEEFFFTFINFLYSILLFLNNNNGLVIAIATCFIVWLTAILAKDNRILRQAETEPEVIAYLIPDQKGTGYMNFLIENVGVGLAKNVSFEFIYDKEDFELHHILFSNNPDRGKISFLPAKEKISAYFGFCSELAGGGKGEEMLKPFDIIVKYQNSKNKKYEKKYEIDISGYIDLPGILEKPPLVGINESLKTLANTYGTQFSPYMVNIKNIDNSLQELVEIYKEHLNMNRKN